MSSPPSPRASLLSLPTELRNEIYLYVFGDGPEEHRETVVSPDALAIALRLRDPCSYNRDSSPETRDLRILQTCKQIHDEANLLAISRTPFHIRGECAYPDLFDGRLRTLSHAKAAAIRHLTLTARISHLRALNEAWAGLPFGHPTLHLATLTVVPSRPEVHTAAFHEIADLSQSHTLAYIFGETLRSLRNVDCVEIRNRDCFNEVVWKLFYRSLVYRLWRWGGGACGVRFDTGETRPGGSELRENQWFKAYLADDATAGVETGDEVRRLVGGGELPDPNLAGVGP